MTMTTQVFFSYSSHDSDLRDALLSQLAPLQRSGLVHIWHDQQIEAGRDWKLAIDEKLEAADVVVLLITATFLSSDFCHDVEMARALERWELGHARIVPIIARDCVWEESPISRLEVIRINDKPIASSPHQDEAWASVARTIRHVVMASRSVRPPNLPKPFPGLASFDEDCAAYFFGREEEVEEALATLAESRPPPRWLLIDGPSGAGKSSFARAGIVPAVRDGKLSGRPNAWITTVMRPGHDPIASLAEALMKHTKPLLDVKRSLHAVTDELRSSPTALKDLLREGRPDERHGVLLLVDQLEEAFTLAHADKTGVKQLDESLAAAIDDEDGPLMLVTTIRSDFMGRMGELPLLDSRRPKNRVASFTLQEMKEAGLRLAIEKPAEHRGLSYEDGLVDRIVADASTSHGTLRPGALPLVARVLEELHARREGPMLTARAYHLVGGVGGALATGADTIVDELDSDGRGRAQKLLLRLVKSGRGSEDTRQTVQREAAIRATGDDPEAAERVLMRLSGNPGTGWGSSDTPGRLVVVSGKPGSEIVDLVHEALIQKWGKLRAWIEENRPELELRDDVEDAARQWDRSGRVEGGLPKGAALVRFLGAEQAALEKVATDFLEAAKEAERFADQQARAREEKKRKSHERRQDRLTAGLVGMVLGLLILTSRSILLARELEASKRAQIRQANMSMAAMVAGTVVSQLRALSDAVERVALDKKLARALQNGDVATLQDLCKSTYEFYDDPSHGLKPNGSSPFNMWLILDKDGNLQSNFGKAGQLVDVPKEYAWRDYFNGASKVASKKLPSTYVSRAFKSEGDGFHKFAISALVYGDDDRPVGMIGASVASEANLGALILSDTQSTAVLVAPRDRERADPERESPYLILRHTAFVYGEAVGMDNEQVRKVSEADLNSKERIGQPWWLPGNGRVTSSDHYEDPVAETHPAFEGNWLASFAPVGRTGFVVIVQTREAEAISGEMLFWQLAMWAGISCSPTLLLLLMVSSRWWSSRRAFFFRRTGH